MSQYSRFSVLVANGVNLDLLGLREPDVYGKQTLQNIEDQLSMFAPKICEALSIAPCNLLFFQSNNESEFLDRLTSKWDGALINPGAWTHTSLALGDRLSALARPYVEVHISNVLHREKIRRQSFISSKAQGVVSGFGAASYMTALTGILLKLKANLNLSLD